MGQIVPSIFSSKVGNLLFVSLSATRSSFVSDLVVSNSTSGGSGNSEFRPAIFASDQCLASSDVSWGIRRNGLVAICESMELGLCKMVKSLHVQKSWVKIHHLTLL